MKIYFAGGFCDEKFNFVKTQNIHRLFSFYYSGDFERSQRDKLQYKSIFLDSGAFSADSQGTPIKLSDYCRFVHKNLDKLACYANLDIIGSDEGTYRNQVLMEKEGLNPLPVFHSEDDFKYLELYCQKYDYIAIGGMVGQPREKIDEFLRKCFLIIKKYWPVKIHGFGITALPLLLKFPFYSVDSSSWLQGGKTSCIISYDSICQKIDVQSTKKKGILDKFISIPIVCDENNLRYINRNEVNILEFLKMEQKLTNLWKERGIEWND